MHVENIEACVWSRDTVSASVTVARINVRVISHLNLSLDRDSPVPGRHSQGSSNWISPENDVNYDHRSPGAALSKGETER